MKNPEPTIRYYALLSETTAKGKVTPKYTIVKSAGDYPPMEQLKGKDGKISMYWMEKRKDNLDAPAYRLEFKGGRNLTGIKDYFQDGKLTGFAYGYPHRAATYGKKKIKPNPFYDYKEDGFLFIMPPNEEGTKPLQIEWIVLADAKPLIADYCKMLQMGGFDEKLTRLRKLAK